MSSAEESTASSTSASSSATEPVVKNYDDEDEDDLLLLPPPIYRTIDSKKNKIIYKIGANEYRINMCILPNVYHFNRKPEINENVIEANRDLAIVLQLIDLLHPEDIIFLAKRNCAFRSLALIEFPKVEYICLYGSGGENGAIACDIVERLNLANSLGGQPELVRYQLDLDNIDDVKVIPALFDAVRAILVVVTRFNYRFNTKLIQVLSHYDRNGGKLARLMLVAEDREEEYQLNKIVKFAMTLKHVVDELLIIHPGNFVNVDRTLKRRGDNLRDPKGLKRSLSI